MKRAGIYKIKQRFVFVKLAHGKSNDSMPLPDYVLPAIVRSLTTDYSKNN